RIGQEDTDMANETATLEPKREGTIAQPERIRGGQVYSPNVDIVENENELLLIADVAGATSEDVDINYEQGLLTLHVRIEPRQQEEQTDYLLHEYGVGDYYRSFQIGNGIDTQKIEAEL